MSIFARFKCSHFQTCISDFNLACQTLLELTKLLFREKYKFLPEEKKKKKTPPPTSRGETQWAHSDLWLEVSRTHITCKEKKKKDLCKKVTLDFR